MAYEEFGSFAAQLNSNVIDRGRIDEITRSDAFVLHATDIMTQTGTAEGVIPIHWERKTKSIMEIDGYYLPDDLGEDETPIHTRLDLFICLYTGTDGSQIESLTLQDVNTCLQRAVRVWDFARNDSLVDIEPASDGFEMLSQMKRHSGTIRLVRVFILTDKACTPRQQEKYNKILRAESAKKEYGLRVELVDLSRMSRIVERGGERDSIYVEVSQWLPAGLEVLRSQSDSSDYVCYLAAIPGSLLADLYDEYGLRLLQLNVRAFLQARGKVNKGIQETIKSEPSRFMAYNNGVTAIAEKIEFLEGENGRIYVKALEGLQIVNGGQTMASLHYARKERRQSLEQIHLQMKLNVVDSSSAIFDDLVNSISQYSNAQNKVTLADFSANDPLHRELEKLSLETWIPGESSKWYYERARGSWQVAKAKRGTTKARREDWDREYPRKQVIDKLQYAKYEASWDQMPHKVSYGGQKAFNYYMDWLRKPASSDGGGRTKTWCPDHEYYRRLVAKAILFRETERLVKDEGIPAYRANITTYTVSLISYKLGDKIDLSTIWANQSLSPQLIEVIRKACHEVRSIILTRSGEGNVTEFCKSDACWAAVKAAPVDLSADLPEGIKNSRGIQVDDVSTPSEDLTEIKHFVMSKPAVFWSSAAQVGSGMSVLTREEISTCNSFASKAKDKWIKEPTPRQLKQARLIVKTLEVKTSLMAMEQYM